MRKVVLNDGTVRAVHLCGQAEGNLYIHCVAEGYSGMQARRDFGAKSRTQVIRFYAGDEATPQAVYEGYTRLISAKVSGGRVIVCLTKAEGSGE